MKYYEEMFELPALKPNGREREFKKYSDELKAKVIFEHLLHEKTHRWMDKNILGLTSGKTNGRDSANILYFIGMKADYRGIFKGFDLNKVISMLESKGNDYAIAAKLLRLLLVSELDQNISLDIEAEQFEEGKGIEGNVKYYYGKRYERDLKNRILAIKKHGVNCYTCGFNFQEIYGEHGKDFIEVHHIKPLSTLKKAVEINPETDLVPMCANCHRMIHRRKDNILSIEELREIIRIKKPHEYRKK